MTRALLSSLVVSERLKLIELVLEDNSLLDGVCHLLAQLGQCSRKNGDSLLILMHGHADLFAVSGVSDHFITRGGDNVTAAITHLLQVRCLRYRSLGDEGRRLIVGVAGLPRQLVEVEGGAACVSFAGARRRRGRGVFLSLQPQGVDRGRVLASVVGCVLLVEVRQTHRT